MKNVFYIYCVIIGTLVGAGFASGSEINLFFNQYGLLGIVGIIVSSALFGIIIYKSILLAHKHNLTSFSKYLEQKYQNKKIHNVIHILINVFTCATFFVMVSGFGSFFKQDLNISKFVGCFIIAIMCYFTFRKKTTGIIDINKLLIPIIVIFIFILGIKVYLQNSNFSVPNFYKINFLPSAVLYTSYNSIILIPLLFALKDYTKDQKHIFLVSITSSATLLILSLTIFLILSISHIPENIDLPVLFLTNKLGTSYKIGYAIFFLSAIFTSAISAGFSFLKNINPKYYSICNILLCSCSLLFSFFSFSNLIEFLYPFFGFLGLINFLIILF